MIFTVKYYAATYKGTKRINADDEDDAINKCRSFVRSRMTLPMYSDGYKVVDIEDEPEDNDDDE